jgi:hypothetical protein
VGIVAAVAVVVVLLAGGGGEDPAPATAAAPTATASPAATPCRDAKSPYGSAPGGFAYERADAATREKTVKALGLDPEGVDMRIARRTGISLGSLVGVPTQDPGAYVDQVIGRAQASGAKVEDDHGFEVISLSNGSDVAIGARGCRAVLVTSQDPNGVRYLASAVFGG